jgi:hypothetical protein
MGDEWTYVVGVALATSMKGNNPKNAVIQVAFNIVTFFNKARWNRQKQAEHQETNAVTANSMHYSTD